MRGRTRLIPWVIIIGVVNLAQCFFPTPWKEEVFGAGGVSHMEQTEQAFQTLATQYFPEIDHLTKGMTKARDTISEANADVDKDQHTAALHCDGESFDAAQSRLQTLQQEVIDYLNDDNAQSARQSLGSALHTVQDFYAHSNWVEMGNGAPNDVLGRSGSIAYAGPLDQTCGACITTINPFVCNDCSGNEDGFLGQLTSGYYFGEDTPASGDIPSFKCHHGGFTDNSFGSAFGFVAGKATQGINKDSLNCGFSPHYYAHSDAVDVSIQATIQYIDDIKQKITKSQLRQLFGVGPAFAFCIDTTGSMGDIIESVQEQSIAIVNERLGTPDEPSSYVISPFNDPSTGPVTITSDFDIFQSTIDGLSAYGGDDCPELSMTGILNALAVLDDGSILFMFTDAASKDEGLASEVIDQANTKNINIYIFKFDSGCDDGLAEKRDLEKRADSASNRVYSAVALGTSGAYHSLPRDEVASVGGLIDTLTSVDNNFILRIIQSTPPSGVETYTVPVDSAMTQLGISILGEAATIVINTPSGVPLDLSSSGVTNIILTDGQFVTVKTPQTGIWSVTVTATSNYTLDATGTSSLHFTSFVFSELAGRPGHQGFYPINGSIPYNIQIAAIARLDGTFANAEFDFRLPDGDVLEDVPMIPGSGAFGDPPANSFFTLLTLASGDFFVYATGTDASGVAFQRVLSAIVSPAFSNATFDVSTTSLPSLTNGTSSTSSLGSSVTSYTNATTTHYSNTTTRSSDPSTTLYLNTTSSSPTLSRTTSSMAGSEATVTEIIYTTISTCPVTLGSTIIGGSTLYDVSISTVTVLVTSTSTIPCYKCIKTPTPRPSNVFIVSEIIYTTVTLCSGTNSVVTATSTITSPCEKCTPGAGTITITVSPEPEPTVSPTSERAFVLASAASASPSQITETSGAFKSSTFGESPISMKPSASVESPASVESSVASGNSGPSKTNVLPVSTISVTPFVGGVAGGPETGLTKTILVWLCSIIFGGLMLL